MLKPLQEKRATFAAAAFLGADVSGYLLNRQFGGWSADFFSELIWGFPFIQREKTELSFQVSKFSLFL